MEYFVRGDVVETKKRFGNDDISWKPFLRQLLIASGFWVLYFCMGIMYGAPTVIIPQLRAANVTVTTEMASWLSSSFTYTAIPWVFILATMARLIGRKKTYIFTSFFVVLGFTAFFFSTTPTHLLIAEGILGIPQAAAIAITAIFISEYTSPSYRGMFLCLKGASFLWGIWISNAIGTFSYWKNVPALGLAVSLYSLTVFYWPESPFWYASQNRFAECREAHRWLKGKSESAEKELSDLIQSRAETAGERITLKSMLRREFIYPLSLSMLAMVQLQFSGKLVIAVYAVDILKKLVEDKTTVYASMLVLDGITVICAYIGCLLAKFFKRRVLLLVTSSMAVIFLLTLSLYLYLVSLGILSENVYVCLFFLSGFSIAISSGPMLLSTSLYGELTPCRYKSATVLIVGGEMVLLNGLLLKMGLTFIETFGLHGTFLFYGLSSGVCVVLMYLYLPETKDKTLVEIEEYFREKKVDEGRKLVA